MPTSQTVIQTEYGFDMIDVVTAFGNERFRRKGGHFEFLNCFK